MSIGQIRWRNDPDSCTTLPAAIQHCPQLLDACTIKMLLGGYVSVKYYRRQFMSITDVQPTPSHYITTCSRRQDRHQTLCSLIYVRRYNIIHTVPSIPPTPQTQNRTPYPDTPMLTSILFICQPYSDFIIYFLHIRVNSVKQPRQNVR